MFLREVVINYNKKMKRIKNDIFIICLIFLSKDTKDKC